MMSKKICELNLTLTDVGENVEAEGNLEFEGTGEDIATVFAHLFDMFELENSQAYFLCMAAISLRDRLIEEDDDGTD